ncbi:MAG: type III-B CRISPR module RAMP protein Cmr1 [Thermofilaceae archaeon]
MEWKFKALTDIWTGDIEGKYERLIPTGLMGSIRWWFEVLVRGLGGKACDPTSPERCPDHNKKPTEPGHRCVVCELFGCTGWARKFRLMILDSRGNVIQGQIKANTEFTLRFIPLRPIRDEEWCLLDMTLRLIANYGAIGGKTVFKPSDEPGRQNAFHHMDFGLIDYISGSSVCCSKEKLAVLKYYVDPKQWRHDFSDAPFSWASLQNFWCVKGRHLARKNANESTFNKVIGRKQPKNKAQELEQDNDINRWLAGRQQESKKVFSFKHPEEGRRTFGFVKPPTVDFEKIKTRLGNVWTGFNSNNEFKDGRVILDELCRQKDSPHGGTP